jgi:dolichyl-phosphate beta-glucosyltransferase
MQLSVVVPAYNERVRIAQSIEKIIAYLQAHHSNGELVVVDDGSSDDTLAIVKELALRFPQLRVAELPQNAGKGAAVRHGVMLSQGTHVLISDADLSTPIEETAKLIRAMEHGYPIVIGSRALPESDIQIRQPWYRERMGRIFNGIVQTFILRGIHDTQCGFKLLDLQVAKQLFAEQRENGFTFDVEVLLLAKKFGYSVYECPVVWKHAELSRVSPVFDSTQMLFALGRIWWRHRGRVSQRSSTLTEAETKPLKCTRDHKHET